MTHDRRKCHHCRKHDEYAGKRRTFCPEDGRPCYTPRGDEPEGFKCANYSLCKSFEREDNEFRR